MISIYFLGPTDSYSDIIAHKVFSENQYKFIPCEKFPDIIGYTLSNQDAMGIIPIENSITSDIHENIDALFNNDLQIIKEAFLRIDLQLIGLQDAQLENITVAYSHSRALAQSSVFLKEHNIIPQEVSSTSKGRDIVREKNEITNAVIGSKQLVTQNSGLKIIQESIGNVTLNFTRFVFVKKFRNKQYAGNKASIIFKVPHIPGALAKLLTNVAEKHLNLTKIESRPIPGTNWEYHFWIDLETQNAQTLLPDITDIFEKNTIMYKIIGIYTKGKEFTS